MADSTLKYKFPAGTTQEEINAFLAEEENRKADFAMAHPGAVAAGLTDKPTTIDYLRSKLAPFVRPTLTGAGGVVGGMAGSGVGSVPGAMAGAAAGSEIASGLQGKFPRLFGNPPENPEKEAFYDAATQGAFEALPLGWANRSNIVAKIANKVGLDKISPSLSKALENRAIRNENASIQMGHEQAVQNVGKTIEGTQKSIGNRLYNQTDILDTAAKNVSARHEQLFKPVQDLLEQAQINPEIRKSPELAKAINLYNQTFGGSKTVQMLRKLSGQNRRTVGDQLYKDIASKALSDVTEVRNFKLATGGSSEINQLASNEILHGAMPAAGEFNADAILKALNGKKASIYKEALDPKTRTGLEQLAQTLKASQEEMKILKVGPRGMKDEKPLVFVDNVWKAGKVGAAISFPLGMLAGAATGGLIPGMALSSAGSITIGLGEAALYKFARDPKNVELLANAMKTKWTDPTANIMARMVTNFLRGTDVLIKIGDTEEAKRGYIDEDGRLTFEKPEPK